MMTNRTIALATTLFGSQLAIADSCHLFCMQVALEVNRVAGLPWEPEFQRSCAFGVASGIGVHEDCHNFAATCGEGECNSVFGAGGTTAGGGCQTGGSNWAVHAIAGSGTTASSSQASIMLGISTEASGERDCCPVSSNVAVAAGFVSFSAFGGDWVGTYEVVGCTPQSAAGSLRRFALIHSQVTAQGLSSMTRTHGVVSSPLGSYVVDLEDDGLGALSADDTFSGSGDGVLSVVTISGEDSDFDVNDDGRFSSADSQLLASFVGTSAASDPLNVDRWDFDSSGVIDSADVSILQSLLDNQLGSGLLADLNGDGVVNCDDFDLLPSSPSAVLGDVDYVVQLDADLDGDNDAADRAVVYALLQPSDWNSDGTVDYFDMLAFLADHSAQEPRADLNNDAQWDYFDVSLYVAMVSKACS